MIDGSGVNAMPLLSSPLMLITNRVLGSKKKDFDEQIRFGFQNSNSMFLVEFRTWHNFFRNSSELIAASKLVGQTGVDGEEDFKYFRFLLEVFPFSLKFCSNSAQLIVFYWIITVIVETIKNYLSISLYLLNGPKRRAFIFPVQGGSYVIDSFI